MTNLTSVTITNGVPTAGTGTVGTVDSLQAANGGQINAAPDTNTIMNGSTAITPAFAKVVASSSGATTIVAAEIRLGLTCRSRCLRDWTDIYVQDS